MSQTPAELALEWIKAARLLILDVVVRLRSARLVVEDPWIGVLVSSMTNRLHNIAATLGDGLRYMGIDPEGIVGEPEQHAGGVMLSLLRDLESILKRIAQEGFKESLTIIKFMNDVVRRMELVSNSVKTLSFIFQLSPGRLKALKELLEDFSSDWQLIAKRCKDLINLCALRATFPRGGAL